MNRRWIALYAAVASAMAFGSAAVAQPASGDARFAGRWSEKDPVVKHRFETKLVDGRLALTVPADIAPPKGRTLWLGRVGPDTYATAPKDPVRAQFRSTGASAATLSLESNSVEWFSRSSYKLVRN